MDTFSSAAAEARYAPLPYAALGALLAATAGERFTVQIGAVTVKPEHVVLTMLLTATLWRYAAGVRQQTHTVKEWRLRLAVRPLSRPTLVSFALFALFVLTMLLSSVMNSPDPSVSLRHTAMVALVASGAWLVYNIVSTPKMFRLAVWLLPVFGVIEAIITFASLAAGRFGISFGTQPGSGNITVPYATLWEPNILGSYLAAACVTAVALLPRARSNGTRAVLAVGIALMVTALGLSLARASWFGFLVAVIVVGLAYWLIRAKSYIMGSLAGSVQLMLLALVGALFLLIAVAPALFPDTARGIFVRIDMRYYTVEADPSVQLRATTAQQTLTGIAAHPLVGNGAGSYGTNHVDEKGRPGWISNLELHLLYDSGFAGLLSVLGGVGVLCWAALRALFAGGVQQGQSAPEIIGLLGALAVLFVAYQATEGLWLGFTWVYVGLLARGADIGLSLKPVQS